MRAIRTCLLAMLAACGGGGSKEIDAMIIIPDAAPDAPPDAFEPVFDFTCMGNTAPTTAPANITLAGTATEVVIQGLQPAIAPSHAATVDTCRTSGGVICAPGGAPPARMDTQTTAANGCPNTGCPWATGNLPTGGVPLDAFIKVSKPGTNRTTMLFPPSPFNMSLTGVPALTFTTQAFDVIKQVGGIQQSDANGNLALAIVDCANMPITDTANVTITVKQGGNAVAGTTQIDASQFAAQLAGTFLIFNVPPGTTEVGATYKTRTLRAHNVLTAAQTTTATAIRPGF